MIFVYNTLHRRACVPVTMEYKVNRLEIWLLASLAGWMMLRGVTHCGRATLFKMVSGHPRAKRQMAGYWQGLEDRGCVVQYDENARGISFCITPFGFQVLTAYEDSLNKLTARYRIDRKSKRPKPLELSAINPHKTSKITATL